MERDRDIQRHTREIQGDSVTGIEGDGERDKDRQRPRQGQKRQ